MYPHKDQSSAVPLLSLPVFGCLNRWDPALMEVIGVSIQNFWCNLARENSWPWRWSEAAAALLYSRGDGLVNRPGGEPIKGTLWNETLGFERDDHWRILRLSLNWQREIVLCFILNIVIENKSYFFSGCSWRDIWAQIKIKPTKDG